MAAEVLASGGAAVTVYDRMPSPGRKFLLAGRGGLNLTHSEDIERLLGRYGAATPRLRGAIEAFSPAALRAWCEGLGQATFVGSSGRVFPAAFKTSPLLRAWLARLDALGVVFKPRHRWSGWNDDGVLIFDAPEGRVTVRADATVLALGGASWPRLGSDGGWVETVTKAGIAVAPLAPANCGFTAGWSEIFRSRFEGQPLKRIELSFAGQTVRGEAIITRSGLEGGAVYALSARCAMPSPRWAKRSSASICVPTSRGPSLSGVSARRAASNRSDIFAQDRGAGSGRGRIAARGCGRIIRALSSMAAAELADRIRPCRCGSRCGADRQGDLDRRRHRIRRDRRAISSPPRRLRRRRNARLEAPTGGYLLQASFSTGAAAGRGALDWLARGRDR
jgi:uncharacterized flavoprotein (TIGR03862 family)